MRNGEPYRNYTFNNDLNQIDGHTYDAYGNLKDYGNDTYTYDAADRLARIDYSTTGNQTVLNYDGFNRLIRIQEKDANNVVTSDRQRIWCGLTLCAERINSTTVNRRYYAHGELRGTTKLYSTRDRLGSVRELTDSTGAIRAQYDYDPYGRAIKLQGDMTSDLRYTGHYAHNPSGLTLAPYRAYEPTLGRWLNRDPIGEAGGINLYGYVGDNPLNLIDPTGRWAILASPQFWMGVTAIVGGTAWWNSNKPDPYNADSHKPYDPSSPNWKPWGLFRILIYQEMMFKELIQMPLVTPIELYSVEKNVPLSHCQEKQDLEIV